MRKKLSIAIMTVVMTMFVMTFAIAAEAECSSQDCVSNISVSVGNTAPTIPYVANVSVVVLTGGTTETVYVLFNASDVNGYDQLDHATASVTLFKAGETNRTSSGCVSQTNTTEVTVFNCSVDMQFYDAAGADWGIHATIDDDAAATADNLTETFTVATLDYVSSDGTNVVWSTLVSGSNNNEADGTIIVTNGGNQDYTSLDITAQDAGLITAESFSIDNAAFQTSGRVYMVDNTATDVTGVLSLPSHGASITEEIFFYVDIAVGLAADTYTSDSSWSISVAA